MSDMSKTILLIGTLDTKGVEYLYVRDLIAKRKFHVLMIDTGVIGEPAFTPDFSAAQVAERWKPPYRITLPGGSWHSFGNQFALSPSPFCVRVHSRTKRSQSVLLISLLSFKKQVANVPVSGGRARLCSTSMYCPPSSLKIAPDDRRSARLQARQRRRKSEGEEAKDW